MTHEATKILLMIFILGSLEAAIQLPKFRESLHSLQSAFVKHRSHKRRLPG